MLYAWQNKGSLLLCLLCFAVGAVAGIYVLAPIFNPVKTKIVEQPARIEEKIKTVTKTEVQYVPKEVVVYKDAQGQTVTETEKTDVQAEIKQPTVRVKLNGQPYEFGLLQGETQKFEQGKVTLNQSSEIGINLEVKPQIIDRTKTGGIDLFVGKFSGIGLQFNRIGVDIGTNGRETDYRLRYRAVAW
jgi:hypothetical protein